MLVMEAAFGIPGLIAQAVEQVRKRGTICLLGLCTRPDTFNSFAMLSKEVRLITSAFFTRQEYEEALDALDAGAAEVHFRIASPPTAWPCFYGVDTPDRDKLLAATMSEDEMREHLGVDSLKFISLDGLYRAVGEAKGRNKSCPQYCDACFSGEYPVVPSDKVDEGFVMQSAAE